MRWGGDVDQRYDVGGRTRTGDLDINGNCVVQEIDGRARTFQAPPATRPSPTPMAASVAT